MSRCSNISAAGAARAAPRSEQRRSRIATHLQASRRATIAVLLSLVVATNCTTVCELGTIEDLCGGNVDDFCNPNGVNLEDFPSCEPACETRKGTVVTCGWGPDVPWQWRGVYLLDEDGVMLTFMPYSDNDIVRYCGLQRWGISIPACQ
jgi:hypothetical protein